MLYSLAFLAAPSVRGSGTRPSLLLRKPCPLRARNPLGNTTCDGALAYAFSVSFFTRFSCNACSCRRIHEQQFYLVRPDDDDRRRRIFIREFPVHFRQRADRRRRGDEHQFCSPRRISLFRPSALRADDLDYYARSNAGSRHRRRIDHPSSAAEERY